MHNPFAKPHTPGQWLLGSVCWVVSCLSGFYGAIYGAATFFPHNGAVGIGSIFGSVVLICGVMLRQVLAVGWQLSSMNNGSWLEMLAGAWLLLISFLFTASVILISLGIVIVLVFAGES